MTATKLIAIRTVIAVAAAFIYLVSPGWALIGILLLSFSTLIDWFDGIFAEQQGQMKPFGGFLDISADQCVEYIFWGVFIHLGLVPLWIPLLIVVRNTFINLLRVSAIRQGMPMFGSGSMIRSALGRRLVGSRLSRGIMVLTKGVGFISITLYYYVSSHPDDAWVRGDPTVLLTLGVWALAGLALIHLVRGGLIVWDSKSLLTDFLWTEAQASDVNR
jgi:phosphatidylglycerophosphate synthase